MPRGTDAQRNLFLKIWRPLSMLYHQSRQPSVLPGLKATLQPKR